MRLRKTKFVRDTLTKTDKDKANEIMVNYYLNLAIRKQCRICPIILNKYKKANEQNLNIIYDLKQYCPTCKKLIKLIYLKIDKVVEKS